MSSSFTGFSEDEIQKLKTGKPQIFSKETRQTAVLKPQKRLYHSFSQDRSRVLYGKHQKIPTEEPVLESAKLYRLSSEPDSSTDIPVTTTAAEVIKDEPHKLNLQSDSPTNSVLTTPAAKTTNTEVTGNKAENEIGNLIFESKKDLSEFQAKQKLMEEQNRKRKELLAKALATKTKQTQAETQRLNEINAEFKRLDNLLSNDVKYLRKQIDFASLEYMEAQKRYLRIEKEFLEAKLTMQQRLERKELLTEHLCAIIEKNEERKAEKLNELLAKLNLKPDLEESKEEKSNLNDS